MQSTECVVVRRVACCAEPFSVPREEFEADECLLPFDQNLTDGDLLSRCEARRPTNCGPENCRVGPPRSRVAMPDAQNVCQFVDECTTDEDCTFAEQCCSCCACLEPMPKGRARAETCVVSQDPAVETEPSPPVCVTCPGGNVCQGCRHEHTLSCSPTPGGFRRCQWGPELAMNKCTAERDCYGMGAFGVSCYSPDFNCGGPPPPPGECGVDADCADAGANGICSLTGYCDTPVCIPGCTSDADCSPAEACTPAHHCEPKPCTEREECGPNFECGPEGECVRADCASTTACEGYCVNGFCYDEPGSCMTPPV
jgi:hypothetical protein